MDKRWAQPKISRTQLAMFSPSLDAMIPGGHSIRQLDAVMSSMDWSEMEACYPGHRGQPPIHPRLVTGAILYGLILGIRSSRKLEDASRNRIDYMWYLDGMSIDHSTFADFRVKFGNELKSIFRQLNKVALRLSMSKLVELAADGTRLRANSSVDGVRQCESLERYLDEIGEKFAKALDEMSREDLADNPEYGSRQELEKELARLEKKRQQYAKALETAKDRDALRRRKGGPKTKPVQVPLSDPESHLLPNKEGGYAPNYTPCVVVDKDSRLIVSEDVVDGNSEVDCVIPGVSEVKAQYDQTPKRMSLDGNLAGGDQLSTLAEEGIAVYSPIPALPVEIVERDDLSSPVAEEIWDLLPSRGKGKKLSRSAFVFDGSCYWCPMGKRLDVEKVRKKVAPYDHIIETIYRSKDCSDCRLSDRCLSGKAKYRSIIRDENEKYREATALRMKTEEGKEIYRRRAPTVETVFGYIKGSLGIRCFLTRGMEKVRMEWRWICSAYNLRVLLGLMAKAA